MAMSDLIQSNVGDFPEKIKISGLPLMLQGWNTTFTRCVDDNGQVYYQLSSYMLYRLFDIIGVRIEKKDNMWHFVRRGDYASMFTSGNLFGDWKHNDGGYIMTIRQA